ncbi:MAG: hypothetical protein BWY06_01077 [Candidatus Latescibacteria bacterium ADurb.Bin168]|nr:MAG: hypothetical protein BWY06_01077 [Candidatus Latescibacteria bacterium ADurb.Bin168]
MVQLKELGPGHFWRKIARPFFSEIARTDVGEIPAGRVNPGLAQPGFLNYPLAHECAYARTCVAFSSDTVLHVGVYSDDPNTFWQSDEALYVVRLALQAKEFALAAEDGCDLVHNPARCPHNVVLHFLAQRRKGDTCYWNAVRV